MKGMTIEGLAQLVQEGFTGLEQSINHRFDLVDRRLSSLEERMERVELRLNECAYRFELVELQTRVGRIENQIGLGK